MRTILFGTITALTFFLASCAIPLRMAPRPQPQPRPIPSPEERTEADVPMVPADSAGTGVVLGERLLPHGVLEIGHSNAPLTLLVVTNPFCRYCKEFHEDLLPILEEAYVAGGVLKVQIVMLDLRKYPGSISFAQRLLCAGEQKRGREMLWLLFDQAHQTTENLRSLRGLDAAAMDACATSPRTQEILASQQSWLHSLSVTLIPTFFLNGEKSVGLPEERDLRGWIAETQRSLAE